MDKRFLENAWGNWPFSMYKTAYLSTQAILENAVGMANIHSTVKKKAELDVVLRSVLSILTPTSYPLTNPDVLNDTIKSGGMNIYRGLSNMMDDANRSILNLPPAGSENFKVGTNVAITPGRVIFKNHLIEVIQYIPVKEIVHAEPILIVPAWIMKYYILDLEPKNSMIKWLLEQGHQVFVISWKNPTAEDKNLTMESYRRAGVMAAIDVVSREIPNQKIHAVGYCLGGTMLAIAAATMARDGDQRLGSITLLAAQTDFSEAGEIRAFLDDKQVSLIETLMNGVGYLDGKQMGMSFQLMRPDELIWSKMIREYALGKRDKMNSMSAWNADTTRMPAKMHSEYLHSLYIENQLAKGKYEVAGKNIKLGSIKVPMFIVGASSDNVAPWQSVFKVVNLCKDTTFCLASGGHNQGIVTHPSSGKGSHQIGRVDHPLATPDDFLHHAVEQKGSWWTSWNIWLKNINSHEMVKPNYPFPGDPKAPGEYVFER